MAVEVEAKIKILMVDDNHDTLDNLTKMLFLERDIEIVGMASGGREGIEKARVLRPDIVLMDMNMPDIDGIRATEAIRAELPDSQVVMMSVNGEQDYLRRAMVAGACDYLTKPFTSEELTGSIRTVYAREGRRAQKTAPVPVPQGTNANSPIVGAGTSKGKVVAFYSPKGGVGKTTIAINLAIAIREETAKSVALVDASLLFGDIGVLMNLQSQRTIADLIPHVRELDAELIDSILTTHSSGVKVLLAPPRPEMAELVTGESISIILARLANLFDYVVVDTFPSFQETTLSVLDSSDEVIVLSTLEMAALKNIRLFLETIELLGYESKAIHLVINRVDSATGIKVSDVEANVNHRVAANIGNDWKLANFAANRGVPFLLSSRESYISKGIVELARIITDSPEGAGVGSKADTGKGRGFFGMFRK